MNNLTSILLDKHSHYDIEEFVKQSRALSFDSGKEQRVSASSIPAFEISLTYSNISLAKFEALRDAYEANFANTFICLFDNVIDKRSQLMTNNSEVFIFKDFQFTADARKSLYLSGRITLISSVFFNFTQYQNLFTQSSNYTPTTTTNESFVDVLEDCPPHQVSYKYFNQSLMSQIGASARHIKEKGLVRAWSMSWLLNETNFIKLLTFYRKKGGMLGTFGITDRGYDYYIYYLEDADDYVQTDYFINYDIQRAGLINARFQEDSFKYQKRLDGFYQCTADFVEVKE
jgi:hypothetical protein